MTYLRHKVTQFFQLSCAQSFDNKYNQGQFVFNCNQQNKVFLFQCFLKKRSVWPEIVTFSQFKKNVYVKMFAQKNLQCD